MISIPLAEARRIVIRVPNWVGDVIHSLPALDAVRGHFQDAEITVLGRSGVGTLLKDYPAVDSVISYAARPGDFLPLWRIGTGLRTRAFDLGILLTRSFEGAWIFFVAGIPRRYGYAADGQKWLLTDSVPYDEHAKKLHQVDYYLNLLFPMGIKRNATRGKLVPAADEKETAAKRLSAAGWSREQPLVALCPGASYGPAKRWPANRFSELTKLLIADRGVTVVLLGGSEEQAFGREFPKEASGRLVNLMGRTTLREAMALLAISDVAIANDSGLLHLAAAVGAPVIALFGPTDPDRTGPVGDTVTMLRKPVICSPCRMRDCPIDHCCMQSISVREVYEAVVKALMKNPMDSWPQQKQTPWSS
jgi:heptosyltransferase-2